MARKYAHIKQHEEEIKKMHEEGASYREIGQALGFSREQIKECMRRPRRLAAKQSETVPQRRGRPSQHTPTTWGAMTKENARLRMENELLRDFIEASERK